MSITAVHLLIFGLILETRLRISDLLVIDKNRVCLLLKTPLPPRLPFVTLGPAVDVGSEALQSHDPRSAHEL